jgi:NAD(P)-dependent dehydrogenase (short-subunit alcohol dehydrogenase family)
MQLVPGQVAVVTGAGSGIGRALAHMYAGRGLVVVGADIDTDGLGATVAHAPDGAPPMTTITCDVSDGEQVRALIDGAVEQHGSVDIVCNNAGIVRRGAVWEGDLADWKAVLAVDLWSVLHGIRAAVPHMIRQGTPAHIVNTASVAGLLAFPGIASYDVAKAGVVSLSEALHHELAAAGHTHIGVSVLCPGVVRTNMTGHAAGGMDPADVAAMVADAIESSRFWILTHPGYHDLVQRRAAGVATGQLVVPTAM